MGCAETERYGQYVAYERLLWSHNRHYAYQLIMSAMAEIQTGQVIGLDGHKEPVDLTYAFNTKRNMDNCYRSATQLIIICFLLSVP
jgi:mRNA deadenylase 3'-5' endonuclease subunit Ccr4